jgi:predicted glycoside hydrolase/deacetylase ChbG (UPF0249 family)
MANMPGFEEACHLAHERRLLRHVGAHLVLTEGQPLTDAIRWTRFCDDSGLFLDWRKRGPMLLLGKQERRAVSAELRAQVLRCREHGLPLTHLDSHHQVHNKPGIGALFIAVARTLRVPSIRVAENCGAAMTRKHRAATGYLNLRLRLRGLARTRYFGALEDYIYLKETSTDLDRVDDFEIMTHPAFDDEGALVDRLSPDSRLEHLISKVDGHENAVSYDGASYAPGRDSR